MSSSIIEKALTVDFMRSTFLGGGAPEKIKNEGAKAYEKWLMERTLRFKDIFTAMTWEDIDNCKKDKYELKYHITINSDYKYHQLREEDQKNRLRKVLMDHHVYKKYIMYI